MTDEERVAALNGLTSLNWCIGWIEGAKRAQGASIFTNNKVPEHIQAAADSLQSLIIGDTEQPSIYGVNDLPLMEKVDGTDMMECSHD